MRVFYIFLLFCFSLQTQAQFGISARTNLNTFGAWDDYYNANNINARPFRNTIDIGANYWLRLKNKRIEFLPELTYTLTKTDDLNAPLGDNFSNTLSQYGLNFNTHIYFMDLANDCNCPTFSKQGTFLPKAIHLIISPGAYFSTNSIDISGDASSVEIEYTDVAFKIGAGLGLDIGISDLLTISPFMILNFTSSYSSEALNYYTDYSCGFACDFTPHPDSNNLHPQFGLRVIFRPDYVKSNRY